ncbi:MAG: hypothetical protein AB1758_35085 [Candidatus Eremiobacterota bacterium]
MGVERRVRDETVTLRIPSESNRDLGIFLVFLGVVGAVPGVYLVSRLILHRVDWDWRTGGFLGLGLVALGLWLLLFTRKTFRLTPREIRIQDGPVRKAVVYRWEGVPVVRLRSVEEERAGKGVEVFEVHLVDGHYNYLLDRRPGQQMESRTLAEMVAKAVGCPVREKTREEGEITLAAEELDLPFVERVRRHPALLGTPVEETPPAASPVTEQRNGSTLRFSWSAFHKDGIGEILVAAALLLGIQLLPFRLDSEGPTLSMWDLARTSGDYSVFLGELGFLLLVLVLLSGQRHEFLVDPDRVRWKRTLWGTTLKQVSIPIRELEQISVRDSSRGTFVQLISDRVIVSRRLPMATAAWLAGRLRHHLASRPEG